MDRTDILIIGVIYNTYRETIRYLESLESSTVKNFQLILVDNSNEENPEFVQKIKLFTFANYIKTDRNSGYFGGAKEGLRYYLSMHSEYPQWNIITNVDIAFTRDFIEQLSHIKPDGNLGIVAPSIISKRWNTDYNPEHLNRLSIARLKFYKFLYSSFILHNMYLLGAYCKKAIVGTIKRESKKRINNKKAGVKIYAPHGSCIVFNRNFFINGGTLELPNFLFGEEIILGEMARRAGLDIVYQPGMVINDYEHASTGFFVSETMNKYHRQAIEAILAYYKNDEPC
jgi:GT2 family glycosyltransferase